MMAMHRSLSREGGVSKVEVYAMYRLFVVLLRVCFGVGWKEQNQTQPEKKRPARSVVGMSVRLFGLGS
jgi:hypothetical protein